MAAMDVGGAEKCLVNILDNLDRNIFEIALVLGNKKGGLLAEVPEDIPIINLSCNRISRSFFKLVSYLKKEKPDILVSMLDHTNLVAVAAKIFSLTKTKVVIIEQTTFSRIVKTAESFNKKIMAVLILPYLLRIIYPRADCIVGCSNGVTEDLKRIIKNKKVFLKTIYLPAYGNRIFGLSKVGDDHAWFHDGFSKVILAVGRLIKAKDYPNLLRSFKRVLASEPNAKLIILGSGPELENLKKITLELEISSKVDFLGTQMNPYKYMSKCAVFALSSVREGFAMVIVEAMACGAPVVATNCQSGPGEIIQDGVNGLLVQPMSDGLLSEALIKILKDSQLALRLSEDGMKRAKYFSAELKVKEYEQLFLKLND